MSRYIAFRVDASSEIGTGHLVRCLTLAKRYLDKTDYKIVFITNKLPSALLSLFTNKKINLLQIDVKHIRETPVCENLIKNWEDDLLETVNILSNNNIRKLDLFVVDHYGLDYKWEEEIKSIYYTKTLIIDDLANRKHSANILLDTNLHNNSSLRYEGLIGIDVLCLFGPSFALLREEFLEYHSQIKVSNKSILAMFGGSDPTGESFKLLDAIVDFNNKDSDLLSGLKIYVVAGKANKHIEKIKHFKNLSLQSVEIFDYIDNVAERMAECSYAIGAGGTSVWERMCLGVQSFIVSVAENQLEASKYLDSLGYVSFIGESNEIASKDYLEILYTIANSKSDSFLISDPELLKQIVPGNGCELVVNKTIEYLNRSYIPN